MYSFLRASGSFAATGPLLVLLGAQLYADEGGLGMVTQRSLSEAWPLWLLLASGALFTVGALLASVQTALARGLVTMGALGWAVQAAGPALDRPMVTLASVTGLILLLHGLYPAAELPSRDFEDFPEAPRIRARIARARGAAITSLMGWPLLWLRGVQPDAESFAVLGVALFIGAAIVLEATFESLLQPRWTVLGIRLCAAASVVGIALALSGDGNRWSDAMAAASFTSMGGAVLMRPRFVPRPFLPALIDAVASQPARLLVTTFILLSVVGALLLRLPVASATSTSIDFIDAAFTATSAVCVTGLIVLDTPVDFSPTGQALLLLLIQVGGLGIMSFSTAAFAALGRRLSLRHEAAIADLIGDRGKLFSSLGRLLGITFGVELVGALILFVLFTVQHDDPAATAAWRAFFTSISAFCNAGFALQSDSLIPYASSPLVLHTISLLIIIGGLSPLACSELPALLWRKRVSTQTKLIFSMTVFLLALAAVLVGALEWSHSFKHLGIFDRIHAAYFQSVTLRTAGFNSVDYAQLQPATVWVMTAFMFIGGSPGGTAGGVKTTTVAILMLSVSSAIRGRTEATAFGRRFNHRTVYKAAAIVSVALVMVFAGIAIVSVTQPHIALPDTIFEVVSALGTVGISVGATGQLDDVGKLIIMVCMFIGRVGPLTLFLFLRERHAVQTWSYPEADVDVG